MSFKETVRSFVRDARGNFAVLTALSLVPFIGLTGAGVDLARATYVTQKLQSALDSAVLSAASLSNRGDMQASVHEFVRANLPTGAPWNARNLVVDVEMNALNAKKISVSATIDVPMAFLAVVGLDNMTAAASSGAEQKAESQEIAVVMDISHSMRGIKLARLKSAAKNFVDIMLSPHARDTTSISLIPFGGNVNIGHLYHDYVVPMPSRSTRGIILNPDASEYAPAADIPNKKFRFDMLREDRQSRCIELRHEDHDLQQIPANSRSQIPYYTLYYLRHPGCPSYRSTVVLNSNNHRVLKHKINLLTMSDGTGLEIGATWGAKFLSPSFRGKLGGNFPDRPKALGNSNYQKYAIIMTDGEATPQYRPKDISQDRHLPMGARKRAMVHGRGSPHDTIAQRRSALGRFNHVCGLMKSNGIRVFTIGFDIARGQSSDIVLRRCATSPSDYYYAGVDDLNSVFTSIAAQISDLRLTN